MKEWESEERTAGVALGQRLYQKDCRRVDAVEMFRGKILRSQRWLSESLATRYKYHNSHNRKPSARWLNIECRAHTWCIDDSMACQPVSIEHMTTLWKTSSLFLAMQCGSTYCKWYKCAFDYCDLSNTSAVLQVVSQTETLPILCDNLPAASLHKWPAFGISLEAASRQYMPVISLTA